MAAPTSNLNSNGPSINNNSPHDGKPDENADGKKTKRRTWFQPTVSVMPDSADPDDWNWFTQLRTKIDESNKGIKTKIEKSNKAIVCSALNMKE